MKQFLIILLAAICFSSCAKQTSTNVNAAKKEDPAEREIRAVLCEIETGNYRGAQGNLEKILQKDPQNIYAQRLLPGVLTHQIKKDDKSPENIAQVRKAIEAFEQALKNPKFSADEKSRANDLILGLYDRISEEEKNAAILKKSEDLGITAADRSSLYTKLAAQSYFCANEISDREPVKKIAKRDGKEVFVFTKPSRAEDFEKLKQCTAKGLEFIDKAIELDGKSETAWSFKGSLLIQKTRIAEMEGQTEEKERFKKEFEAARDKFIALSAEKNKQVESRTPNASPETETVPQEIFEELTVYKAERPLDNLVNEIYIPTDFVSLVEPVPPPVPEPVDPKTAPEKDENKKREWKTFSPNGEFSAEMPDNAEFEFSFPAPVYKADTEGVNFMIISQPRPDAQNSGLDDKVLNTLAWTMAKSLGNLWISEKWGNSFEIKFVRKETFGAQPAQIYAYTLNTCADKKDGTVLVLAGKKNNYSIDIRGANEQDARTQRFLKSLKIN